jgi:hypothetical protein
MALEFFSRDVSSVDGEMSYDDLAMTPDRPDAYDELDKIKIRRGMGLNRHPKTGWQWLIEHSPVDLVTALPRNAHLGEIGDADYPAVRGRIESALRGFIGETGVRRGLAVATKVLHVKRPALIPICDSYTVAMLGVPLKPDAGKEERVSAGLWACDVVRQAVQENATELAAICGYLTEQSYPRTPVRVLDALLWLAYGGTIREGRPRPA